jgi:hypothetical protein
LLGCCKIAEKSSAERARQRFTGACRPFAPFAGHMLGFSSAVVDAALGRLAARRYDKHTGNKPVAASAFLRLLQPALFPLKLKETNPCLA